MKRNSNEAQISNINQTDEQKVLVKDAINDEKNTNITEPDFLNKITDEELQLIKNEEARKLEEKIKELEKLQRISTVNNTTLPDELKPIDSNYTNNLIPDSSKTELSANMQNDHQDNKVDLKQNITNIIADEDTSDKENVALRDVIEAKIEAALKMEAQLNVEEAIRMEHKITDKTLKPKVPSLKDNLDSKAEQASRIEETVYNDEVLKEKQKRNSNIFYQEVATDEAKSDSDFSKIAKTEVLNNSKETNEENGNLKSELETESNTEPKLCSMDDVQMRTTDENDSPDETVQKQIQEKLEAALKMEAQLNVEEAVRMEHKISNTSDISKVKKVQAEFVDEKDQIINKTESSRSKSRDDKSITQTSDRQKESTATSWQTKVYGASEQASRIEGGREDNTIDSKLLCQELKTDVEEENVNLKQEVESQLTTSLESENLEDKQIICENIDTPDELLQKQIQEKLEAALKMEAKLNVEDAIRKEQKLFKNSTNTPVLDVEGKRTIETETNETKMLNVTVVGDSKEFISKDDTLASIDVKSDNSVEKSNQEFETKTNVKTPPECDDEAALQKLINEKLKAALEMEALVMKGCDLNPGNTSDTQQKPSQEGSIRHTHNKEKMSDTGGDRDTRQKEEAEREQDDNEGDDDELPDLPGGDDTLMDLPEIEENGDGEDEEEQPDLPEADQKEGLPEVDQDENMDPTDNLDQVPNGEANGDVEGDPKKKKKRSEDGERKGKKKRKKGEKEKKKAAYSSRDEIYEKKIGPRVRSFDASKMKNKFDKPKAPQQISSECKLCGKQVFQMEKIVAEKASWHKNCFRCKECNKALTLDTYSSHEGVMYCKPHFKQLFQPKAVVVDPEEAHRERMARRPKMIIVESKPEELPEDVVRASSKPDYGLEDIQTMDVKQRFSMFESLKDKDDDKPKLEPASVRRSSSLMNKAAKFLNNEDEYGIDNSELGEYEEDEDDDEEYEEDDEEEGEEEEEEEGEEEYDENGERIEKPKVPKTKLKKKERPMSFTGMGDLQTAFEKKTRREKMSQQRKEELSKFRQMLCAGKNISLKEKFESGVFDDDEGPKKNGHKETVKIEGRPAARSLRERFEKGEGFSQDEEGNSIYTGEKQQVEAIFKDAETANKARNLFKQIDSQATQEEGTPVLRGKPQRNSDIRRLSGIMSPGAVAAAELIKRGESLDEEDEEVETKDLASRFLFFANYAERQEEEREKKRKPFSLPRAEERDKVVEDIIKAKPLRPKYCMAINCAVCKLRGWDYEDEENESTDPVINADCPNTQNILKMFRKMELQSGDDERGPRPLKEFTPPPEGDEYEDDEEEYSDEDEYSDDEEDEEEEETDEEGSRVPKYRDEFLEMHNSSQSAKKAANLRAKFEKWETEVERQNEINKSVKDEDGESMPSLDTARNLRAMFENKAKEDNTPQKKAAPKINRFVGGGGEKCVACDKTVYAMERLEIVGRILHKNCFRCVKCNSKLGMGSFSVGGGQMYCTTHYKQAFTEKGSYDIFNSDKDKGKWTHKIEATSEETIKSQD